MQPRTLIIQLLCAAGLLATSKAQDKAPTLLEARSGHTTQLIRELRGPDTLPKPPPELFTVERYEGPLGSMHALLSKPRKSGVKSPAIIWLTGGFPVAEVGSFMWEDLPAENDQSAGAYRAAGMILMFPTLRGCHGNPGQQESFYGEVQDVLAALAYLRKVDFVDPERIYLGGHSTGGTLALLVAEATDQFRAVISFGPISDPGRWPAEALAFDTTNDLERRLRAPIHYLQGVRSPTFIIEGVGQQGKAVELERMGRANKNDRVHFFSIERASHFDVLAPLNRLIAGRLAGLAAGDTLKLSLPELQAAFDAAVRRRREVTDLHTLANVRASGVDFEKPVATSFYLLSWDRTGIQTAAKAKLGKGWQAAAIKEAKSQNGETYFVLKFSKTLNLSNMATVFEASRTVAKLARDTGTDYDGWFAE